MDFGAIENVFKLEEEFQRALGCNSTLVSFVSKAIVEKRRVCLELSAASALLFDLLGLDGWRSASLINQIQVRQVYILLLVGPTVDFIGFDYLLNRAVIDIEGIRDSTLVLL